jgi:hypothetical protein
MRRGLTFSELAVVLVFLAAAALACLSPAQADTFWALRAGEDIWRTGHVPLFDTYSHTAAGRPWPDHEWLWQALAYGLFRLGGFPLLTLAVAGFVVGAQALAYRLMAGPWTLRVALLLGGLTLGTNAWSIRPQAASLLMLAVLLKLLVDERLWGIPVLFAVWANLHGGVVLGGAVMVAATAAALAGDRARFRRLALVTVVSGAATLLTPLGVGLWTFILHWMAAARATGVSEWDPVSPFTKEGVVFWTLALAFLALCARRWRAACGPTDRMLAIVALVLLLFAARSVRNVAPFLLVATVAASRLAVAGRKAQGGAVRSGEAAEPARREPAEHPKVNLGIAAAAGAIAIAAIAVAWSKPSRQLGWRPITAAAAAAISACPGPLYNGYNQGGVLIWFVRDKPVFIDGRHDPYPPELIIEDGKVERGGDHRALFERHGIRCAALSADAILAGKLREAGWRPRFADAEWTVLER